VNDVRLEFSLHEDHQRRDIADSPVDLGDLGPDEGEHPGMFAAMLAEGNAMRSCCLFLPGEVLRQVVSQPREQRQAFLIIAGNGEQSVLHLLHFVKQMVMLGVHFADASQQFDRNENLGHITPISRRKTTCLSD